MLAKYVVVFVGGIALRNMNNAHPEDLMVYPGLTNPLLIHLILVPGLSCSIVLRKYVTNEGLRSYARRSILDAINAAKSKLICT